MPADGVTAGEEGELVHGAVSAENGPAGVADPGVNLREPLAAIVGLVVPAGGPEVPTGSGQLDRAGEGGAGLNSVGNGGLHTIEEEETAEDDDSDDGRGSQKENAGRLAATGDGPPEPVNDAGHGVEAVEPAPAWRNESGRIGDGRGKHPELDKKRNDIFDVAIKSVESGKPEAYAESGEDGESQEGGEPKSGKGGANAVSESEKGEDCEADGEVHEAGESAGDRKNEAREIDFGDEALVVDDDVGGHLKGGCKIGPGDESGEIKDGIGEAVRGELGEVAEEKSEDKHVEDGLEDDPQDADGGLFVADLDVAPDEKVEELAVCPDFPETKLEKAAGRLDSNDGGSAGMGPASDAGLCDGCHARSNETDNLA